MKRISLLLQWACIMLIAMACHDTDEPSPDEAGLEEGYATGKVTNTDGSPMQGVKVVVDNTMIHASYSIGSSDENGNYKIQLPKVGTFMASAHIVKKYNGREYEFDLDPDVYEAFSIDGAVRNFQWKLTGRRPIEAQGYYGVTIEVNKDVMSAVYDSENIEFTLVPVGNLIDGSKGKTLKMKHGKPYTNDYGRLVDIPLGRYMMTAYYNGEAGEIPLKLRKHFSEDEYTDELTIDFEPHTMWGNNIAFISYSE
ncbi:carboxypeptidase-like regulatory domain-containing protein [Dyadobacter sp. LJ53]|uniref:carboxypeptidase-like regulatory domain-containing protein n=1 Tax=Dyadobacter chenwenxiniae TaxID=2906456 RepID=UPI001F30889B|nr:carboxypeptidase-like regulatory domain-containing protein [Dyadobacter chenwenxiniae]MCF0052949.1 carboxypeptidase-like regulatory domain-containing protein [Dyadobacter chenwenxiniae]